MDQAPVLWPYGGEEARKHAVKLRRLYFEEPRLAALSDDVVNRVTIVNDASMTALCRRARAYMAHHDPAWVSRLDRGEFDCDLKTAAPAPGAWNRDA